MLIRVSRFVICNDGYTIERYIHGFDAAYNDVQTWKYKDLLSVFGADPQQSKTFQVKTRGELDQLFSDREFAASKYIQVSHSLKSNHSVSRSRVTGREC